MWEFQRGCFAPLLLHAGSPLASCPARAGHGPLISSHFQADAGCGDGMLCFRSGLGLRLGLEPLLPEPPVPSPSSHPSLFRNTCQESEPIAAVSLTDGWCPNLTNYRLSVGTILHTRYSSAQRRAAGSSERYYFLGGRIYRTRSYNSSKLPKLTARCPRLTTPASPRAWRRSQEFLSRPPSPNNKPFALSVLYG